MESKFHLTHSNIVTVSRGNEVFTAPFELTLFKCADPLCEVWLLDLSNLETGSNLCVSPASHDLALFNAAQDLAQNVIGGIMAV
jgi:hypothetical protein